MPLTIAIDGPAASGKGTLARALAERFGFAHLDTGMLYRAVGARGGDPVAAAQSLTPDDLARPDLRSAEAGLDPREAALEVGERGAHLGDGGDAAGGEPGAVLDGRDIGTVICPDAAVKLYVVADDATRAARRAAELGADPAEMLAQIRDRDARDAARHTAPMRAAPDAVVLDTTRMTIDEAVAAAVALVTSRLGA